MKKLYVLVFTIGTFLCVESSTPTIRDSMKFHLPRDLKPLHYNLEIFSDLFEQSIFWGTVFITVKCDESTNRIILHQNGLKIEPNVQVKQLPVISDSPSIIEVKDYEYVRMSNQYVIILEKKLEKDENYEIKLEFSSRFRSNATGYVLHVHEITDRIWKRIAFTKMDQIGARYIFPCFDEIGMKATFTMRIGRPSTMKGFSNANFRSTELASFPQNWVVDEFEKTVLMEASALAIVLLLADFESKIVQIQLPDSSNIEIRTWADSSILNELEYFRAIVVRIFQFFLSYFKIEYAFKKLDIFVLHDLNSRAISSYGVIYMSDIAILEASKEPTSFAGYKMVSELCHVMSKQWIGYVTTMSNYNEDYLHTALNLLLQTICVADVGSSINHKWEITFLKDGLLDTFIYLFVDELHRPIFLMGKDSDFLQDFGSNKLVKAYLFFRTLHEILGSTLFQKCISNYLMKFKFANSSAIDLYDVFTNTVNEVRPDLLSKHGFSVNDIADSWLNQKGYPLITVLRNDDTNEITISQEPFYSSEEEKQEDMIKRCWLLPVSYTTKSDSEVEIYDWLTCTGSLVMTIDVPRDDWILFDLNANGRINYDEPNWKLIVKSLVYEDGPIVFDRLTRARLISDMFALAEVGKLSYQIALDAMKYLPRETYKGNLMFALEKLNKIWSRLQGTSISKSFQKYVRRLLDPVFNREEFKNLIEFPMDTTKIEIIRSSCKFGVKACREQSLKIIARWRKEETIPIIPEIVQNTVRCEGIKHGNKEYWDLNWNSYKEMEKGYKRKIELKALGCSTNIRLLKRFLAWSINGQKIVVQDSIFIVRSVLANREGYKLVKKFFTDYYDEILKFQHGGINFFILWNEILEATVRREDLNDLERLADSKLFDLMSPTSRTYESYKKALKNVSWFERSKETFSKYFRVGIFSIGWLKF